MFNYFGNLFCIVFGIMISVRNVVIAVGFGGGGLDNVVFFNFKEFIV